MIAPSIKKKIQSIVSVFETSSTKPRYGILVCLADGPKDSKGNRRVQITYGKHQTTEYGNLKSLLQAYCASPEYGRYAKDLRPFLPMIGDRNRPSLATNLQFKNLLKAAGDCEVMQRCQDKFFDETYWNPSFNFFKNNGFTLPLSMLVIYDSYIHSGGIPAWLRDDFKCVPPLRGGNEKEWVKSYVTCRDNWLQNHSDKILQNTDYRTDCFLEELEQGNWDLSGPVVCKFNQRNPSNWITIN